MQRIAAMTLALLFCALLAGACRRSAEVANACEENEEWCLPCKSDAECHFTGNPCVETVYCAHRDAAIATVDLGCSAEVEYSWPADTECQCKGTCQFAGK